MDTMENKDLKTIVTDNFPLSILECQFYQVCKHYNPDRCTYGKPCQSYLLLDNIKAKVRDLLRHSLELYVSQDCLKIGIQSIIEDRKN